MESKQFSIMQKSAQSCVKCAKCVPSCTIYSLNRDEITSPRGYLDLVNAYSKGTLSLDLELKNAVESCFLCTTCVTQCPMSLPVDLVIERVRVDVAKKYGIPLYKRILFFLLGRRSVLNLIFSLGFYFNPCLFKTDSNGGKKLRFAFGNLKNRIISPLNKKSFLQKYSGVIESKNKDFIESNLLQDSSTTRHTETLRSIGEVSKNIESTSTNLSSLPISITNNLENLDSKTTTKRPKVAIYIGCLSNYNYINVGESLLKILDRLGIDVLVPPQECCGAPAFFSGDIKNTTRLVKKNLSALTPLLDELDALLVPEATCAAMLLSDWHHALEIESEVESIDNTAYFRQLESLKKKTFMASKWLHDFTPLDSILANAANSEVCVTYHDPCHARKVLKIFNEPRNLLKNFRLKEMKDSSVCCGFGGVTIQSEKYELAKGVGDKKAQNIIASGAEIVSAECSACRMQIDDSLSRNNAKATFKHPLELIAENLGL